MNRWRRSIITAVIVVVCFLMFWGYTLFAPTISNQKGEIYYLHANLSKHIVINQLSEQGLIRHPWLFALYAYSKPATQLKSGEYLFPKSSSPISIWRQVTSGTGLYYRPFIIIPGWTFKQVRDALNNNPWLRHQTTSLSNDQIMEKLSGRAISPEGLFFPETYNFTRDDKDWEILKNAYDLMQQKMANAWLERTTTIPYQTSYEALIAASMIEKEGFLDSERPIIASVLINRLNKAMLLQIDATVIYGMGDKYQGTIRKSDLLADTIYNTYVHKGLPPTPIAMPGLASIKAALHPMPTTYFYYVARGDGSHQFSETLAEHEAAVKSAKNATKTLVSKPN